MFVLEKSPGESLGSFLVYISSLSQNPTMVLRRWSADYEFSDGIAATVNNTSADEYTGAKYTREQIATNENRNVHCV